MSASLPRRRLSGQTGAVVGMVFGAPDLRRIQLAFAGFSAAEWAIWIALLVYAYEQSGAAVAVLIAVVALLPAMIFAPVGSVLGDRYRLGAVLTWTYVVQASGMAVAGFVLLAHGSSVLVYTSFAVVVA